LPRIMYRWRATLGRGQEFAKRTARPCRPWGTAWQSKLYCSQALRSPARSEHAPAANPEGTRPTSPSASLVPLRVSSMQLLAQDNAASQTTASAEGRDAAVRCCLERILETENPNSLPNLSARRAHLELQHGGLAHRSASLMAPAAHWASQADSLAAIHPERHPQVANRLIAELNRASPNNAEPFARESAATRTHLTNNCRLPGAKVGGFGPQTAPRSARPARGRA
jgi:hypothetical protein